MNLLLEAGCKAILVSVDIPILGRRLNEMRNDFALPTDMAIPNMPVGSEEIIRGTNDGINYGENSLEINHYQSENLQLSRSFHRMGRSNSLAQEANIYGALAKRR